MAASEYDLDDLMRELGVDASQLNQSAPGNRGALTEAPGSKPSQESPMPRRKDSTPQPADLEGKSPGDPSRDASHDLPPDDDGIQPLDSVEEFWTPTDERNPDGGDLHQRLLECGAVAPDILETAKRVLSQSPGRGLPEILMEMGASQELVQKTVAEESGLPFESIEPGSINRDLVDRLGGEFCEAHGCLPLRQDGNRVVVGTVRPDDGLVLDQVKTMLGVSAVKHALITPAAVQSIVEVVGADSHQDYDVESILADVEEDDVEVIEQSSAEDEDDAQSSPVVRYVNHLIQLL